MYRIKKNGYRDSYICEVSHITSLNKYVPTVHDIARACTSLCLEVDLVAGWKAAVECSFTTRDVFQPLSSRLSCGSYQTLTAGKSDSAKAFLDRLTIDDACIMYAQCLMSEELMPAFDHKEPASTNGNHTDPSANHTQNEKIPAFETLEPALWKSSHFLRKRGLENTDDHVKMVYVLCREMFAPPLTKNGCRLDDEKETLIVDAYIHELQARVKNVVAHIQTEMVHIENGKSNSITQFFTSDRGGAASNDKTIWKRNAQMADAFYDEIAVNNGNVFAALGMLHTRDHESTDWHDLVAGSACQKSVITHMRNKGFIVEHVLDNVFLTCDDAVCTNSAQT
jgi:hypothetical protein